jgi:hypothetical protein
MVDFNDLEFAQGVALSVFFDKEGNHRQFVHDASEFTVAAKDALKLSGSPFGEINNIMASMGFEISKKAVSLKGLKIDCYTAKLAVDAPGVSTPRNIKLREKQKALGLEPVQTVLHPDDKAALLDFAFQLRVRRGTLTPTDMKRVNDAATKGTDNG